MSFSAKRFAEKREGSKVMSPFSQKLVWTVLAIVVGACAKFVSPDSATFFLASAGMILAITWRPPSTNSTPETTPSKPPTIPPILPLLMLTLACLFSACAYAKPACQVIKIADNACDILTVEMPDGGTMQISKRELKNAAERTSLALDGGK